MNTYHRLAATAGLITFGCALVASGALASKPVSKPGDTAISAKCKADLAKRLKAEPKAIELISSQAVSWPNSALGMPEIGKMYAQMITPGFRVILANRGTRYLYTTGSKSIRYGGPEALWSQSLLYLKSVPNEANLNSDLYQCSMIGTNSARIASAVSDFYPQASGIVIFKRRMSRSGHELLYIKADGKSKEKTLRSAMDFGDAAINEAGNQWAGFVRPRLGTEWDVVVAPLAGGSEKTIALPDGVWPGKIAWSGEKVMILGKKGEMAVCFETSSSAAKPEWKAVQPHEFAGEISYMLNKSESLEIVQIEEKGKLVVEVARVWFTGDRNLVARIVDLELKDHCLIGGGYAFISGERSDKTITFSVNISSDLVIPGFIGDCRGIKPFACPPMRGPLAVK